MELNDLMLSEEDAASLEQYLARFVEDTGVRVALVMGRDGHLLSRFGMFREMNLESLCALAVGAFASSEALARLAGEDTFSSIFHQGVTSNVFISLVGDKHLMLTLFDYNASAPLVRLQARVTGEAIITVIERAYTRTRARTRAEMPRPTTGAVEQKT